jgi:diketogulonate reductase-like aldo/keto reductase
MHCETTVDPTGTWRQSYRALERLYHEGHLLSIGVSNFDQNLLREVSSFAKVLPHAVQNHGEINRYDLEVRRWCRDHGAVYMPYASGRNIKSLPSVTLELLESVSRAHNVSKHATVSQLFLQTGAVVIPRATHERHLQENLGLLSWELQRTEIAALGWKAPLDEERVAVEVDPQS